MKISIGTAVLAAGDVSDEQPYDVKINNTRNVQIASIMRAETIKGFDRGNQQTTLEFKVSKRHDSVEDSQKYIIQHAADLKNPSSVLTITEEPSQDIYSLNDSVISEVQSICSGTVSLHVYKIIGGNFTKN